ncbi:MAG: transaldolase [Chloroflexi bacterium]|nr:transaldolase [Chloroflexota bacterium]
MECPNLKEVRRLGQSVWLDFISRELVASGRLKGLVGRGLAGMTSNPTIFHKSISQGAAYDESLRSVLREAAGIDTKALYDRLIVQDIQMAADALRPVYDATGGADGLVSLEPPAQMAYDTGATMAEVRRLWRLVSRPNVMIKVPATPQGIPVIEALLGEGININITLMFSMKHYEAVSHAYMRGIARHERPEKVVSVASFFVSRVDTYVDRELERIGTEKALSLRGKAAIANSKLVYQRFRDIFSGEEFAAQRGRGARVQRVLWGSTSAKNPVYPDTMYVDELIGPDTVNTMPLETLEAFCDHGRVGLSLETGLDEASRTLAEIRELGVDFDGITEQLQVDGVKAFADSLEELMKVLEEKRRQVPVS